MSSDEANGDGSQVSGEVGNGEVDHGGDGAEEEPVAMRFTVIDRSGGRVHLVSEGGGEVFAHPAVADEVWEAALEDLPAAWEIVDLADDRNGFYPPDPLDPLDADELAGRQFELLTSFVRAGFERVEALALVIELLRVEGPGG